MDRSAFGARPASLRARLALYGTLAFGVGGAAFVAASAMWTGAAFATVRALVALALVALALSVSAGTRRLKPELRAVFPRAVLGAAVVLAAGLAIDLGPAALVLPLVVIGALAMRTVLLRRG